MRICRVRPATEAELNRLQRYLDGERERFRRAGGDESTAWTSLARVVLNLDEFIVRE